MKLEIQGLTREQELTWLLKLPWTFTSLRTTESPDEYEVHVEEIRDAMSVGDEKFVSRDIWDSLRASLECRLEFDDAIPIPRQHILASEPIIINAMPRLTPTEPTPK